MTRMTDLGGSARLWLDQREHGAKGDAVARGHSEQKAGHSFLCQRMHGRRVLLEYGLGSIGQPIRN